MTAAAQAGLTPDDFLIDHERRFTWRRPDMLPQSISLEPIAAFNGRGTHPLEVGLAMSTRKLRADELRRAWLARQGRAPNPLLLVVAYADGGRWVASICGPAGDDPPVESGLPLDEVERIASAALAEPSRHAAIRFVSSIWSELESDLPGLRNHGMFATHDLREGVPLRDDWSKECETGRALFGFRGRELVEQLGFAVESHATAASVLSVAGTKRAIAVFLDEGEEFENVGARFGGSSPVSHALALADREGLPWVVLTRGRQIRVHSARSDVGVGRKGRAETYVEANLALLPGDRAGYLPLLFSAAALSDGGTFEAILDESRDYAAALGARLRERVYFEAVPKLAVALAKVDGRTTESALDAVYEQALTVLFRLLFVAYAEDKDLLPYRTNGAYRDHALKTTARELAQRRIDQNLVFDANATDLWDDVVALWTAVDKGNVERGVPVYNGGLFSSDPGVNEEGAALASVRLANADFGPVLSALLVDEGDGDVVGPVDFRSLSVREFGTIYEGLLESNLSLASTDLTVDRRGNYMPARGGRSIVVPANEVYFHDRSGARKATGSYFTKPFAVEHLLDQALEPALDDHLARVEALLESGEDAAAAAAFFDFRCADLAMGSGHFLVAAVDRIEARFAAFLALHPIPHVLAELDELRAAALAALGPLGEGVEIEQTSLLRRQVARRCVYGADVNRVAVELARLAIWIHTFVPGLPLSFLDHALVHGDSLVGVGTIDEAITALDPEHVPGQASLFRDQIVDVLARAQKALTRLSRLAEATKEQVDAARAAAEEARAAVEPAEHLCDLVLAGRLGEAAPLHDFDPVAIAQNPDLATACVRARELRALHFPIAFPEVFLRETPGFDCILGNPPWEEATVEELGFWALRFPGLKSLTAGDQKREIAKLSKERRDLVDEYAQECVDAARTRKLLLAGPYPGMGTGDPDLYKAFSWRFWQLVRDAGRFGVVLPRSALAAKGSAPWRQTILVSGEFADVTMLLNTAGWVFDDAEPRYTIALVSARKGTAAASAVRLRGPFASRARYDAGMAAPPAELDAAAFASWSEGASFPLLPTDRSVAVFLKLRAHPRLDAGADWVARPYTELHATNDRRHFDVDPPSTDGLWPVYKGASFDLWNNDTGEYYAWADPSYIRRVLQEKRQRARSAFDGFAPDWMADPETLPCNFARIAFRDVTRATDSRTVRTALVPPHVVITNKGPYLLWPVGDERDQAFVLGVLSAIPLDWYARRFVETSLNYHIFNGFPVPRQTRDDPIRRRVVEIAGRLAATDGRYSAWADAVGVQVGSVTTEETKQDLVAELDAAVAHLYALDADDLHTVFETFHEGWDYAPRLAAVLEHFERLR